MMTSYRDFIESAPLITRVESATTTGDGPYDGTALEIADEQGRELFHVVVDSHGERQFLFFGSERNYRLPLRILEEVLVVAKEKVKPADLI